MNEKTYTKHPEALNIAFELTAMIVDRLSDIPDTSIGKDLRENPENTILNIFERCLHVANDGHVRTTYMAQNGDSTDKPAVY